jgi:hypothetical protein
MPSSFILGILGGAMGAIATLDTTNKSLKAKLLAAQTTNPVALGCSFGDSHANGSELVEGGTNLPSNGVTPVELVAAPASGYRRPITRLTAVNNDTVSQTVEFYVLDGANVNDVKRVLLTAGASWDSDRETPSTNALLDGLYHSDTVYSVLARGGILRVNSTSKWEQLAKAAAGQILSANANDVDYQTFAALAAYLLTANGDIPIRDNTGNVVRLAKPAVAGSLLGSDANGIPAWYNFTNKALCCLNGATALALTDKAYFDIPAEMNGWKLTGWFMAVGDSAAATGASTSGIPTLTVKNGSVSMFSTNPTVDAGEYTSATAATPAVIDTNHNTVATNDQIKVEVSVAGTGVAFCRLLLKFQAG